MNSRLLLQQIAWIFEKEMRYALRDTDVLIYSILVPLLIYPGTLLAASEVLLWQIGQAQHNLKVHVKNYERLSPHLYGVLAHIPGIIMTASLKPERDLETGKLDAVVAGEERKNSYSFVTYVCGKKGMLAANKLNDALVTAQSLARLEAYKNYHVPAQMLHVCSINENRLVPFTSTEAKVESHTPLGVLALLALGFLQIGLTAGVSSVCVFAEEKEKKTFETTMSIPVPAAVLTAGKWLTASSLSLFSGIINIIAVSASAWVVCLQTQLMQKQNVVAILAYIFGSDLFVYGLALCLLLLCAGMSTAVCLLFVSACKNFKDAQALVTYPMLLIISLPMLAFVPGIEQVPALYFLPFTNMLLCAKHPQGNYLNLALMLAETTAIIVFCLWLSGKMFFCEKSVLNLSGWLSSQRSRQPTDSL